MTTSYDQKCRRDQTIQPDLRGSPDECFVPGVRECTSSGGFRGSRAWASRESTRPFSNDYINTFNVTYNKTYNKTC